MTHKCNIIIDSCCDLPHTCVEAEGVYLVRFPYTLDGEERVDDLYQTTSPKAFFDTMRDKKKLPPTTMQAPIGTLTEVFMRALDTGIPSVYLSFSSELSGSYDTAVLVRDQLLQDYPEGELYIVDTKLASIAEGLLVEEAIAQRASGLSAEELAHWAEEARWYVHAQFMVDDLASLNRGGRIPSGVATLGTKLDVKPLLSFDLSGRLSFVGMARGRKKGVRSIAEYFRRRSDSCQVARKVIIGNADCPSDAKRLRDELLKSEDGLVFVDASIGPVIGCHVGPGMIACAFWGPDRREDLGVADRIAKRVKERG